MDNSAFFHCYYPIEMRGNASKVDPKTGEGSKPFGTALVSDLIDSEKTVKIRNADEMDKNDIDYNKNGANADKGDLKKTFTLAYGLETLKNDGKEPTGEEGFGEGAGSTIDYNPNDTRDGTGPGSGIMNADGTCGKPPVIGLGHELIHARHMANGEVDGGDSGTVQPEDRRTGVSNEEFNTRSEENILREEHGVVPRAEPVKKDE